MNEQATHLRLTIDMDVNALSNFVNLKLPEVLFDSKDAPNFKDIKVLATKGGKLKIRGKDYDYIYLLPIRIKVEKNVAVSNVKAEGVIVLGMKTSFSFKDNWEMDTQTVIEKYEWLEKPNASLGGFFSVPVESMILDNLLENKDVITGAIDKEIQRKVNIGDLINKNMNQIPNPILVPFVGNIGWKLSPGTTTMAPMKFVNNAIQYKFSVKTDAELAIDDAFLKQPVVINPPAFQEDPESRSQMSLKAYIDIASLNQSLNQHLVGKDLDVAGKKLVITELNIKSENGLLVIDGKTTGAFKGDMLLKASPVFDNNSKEVYLTNVDVDLKGNDIVSKGLAALLNIKINDIITNQMRYSLKKDVDKLNDHLRSKEIHDGIFINANLTDYSLHNFNVGATRVDFEVHLGGTISMQIKEINVPKELLA